MRHRKRFPLFQALLLLTFVASAGALAIRYFVPHAEPARLFNKETKLKVHEPKIVSVPYEFTRRSSKFRDALKEYADCAPRCPQVTMAKLESVVKADWPRVAEHLLVYKDWDPSHLKGREQLEDMVALHGKDGVINRCVPKFSYTASKTIKPFATLEKFVCTDSSAQKHARR